MTSSNSMSSGYCSLDDESEDFSFFTAKTSFFRKPKQAPKVEAKEEDEGGTKDLSEEEVRQRIEDYNSQMSENGMKLAADGSYTGFIKVHLRLSRPVTVQAGDGPGNDGQTANHNRISSDGQEESDCVPNEKRTSFYLPSDCVKQLHISSLTTTREVIQGLLKKFMVLDNPRKFALYRQTHRDGQDLFQKLPLFERPLLLRLIAGPDPEQLSFVLKENETGEVEWHAFSVPELQNFLVILEKEEKERVRAVEQKYTIYRKKLQHALQQQDPWTLTCDLRTLTQGKTGYSSPDPSRPLIYSEPGAGAEQVSSLHVNTEINLKCSQDPYRHFPSKKTLESDRCVWDGHTLDKYNIRL